MRRKVEKKIKQLREKHGVIPLFYVESGSRLWGFASKDSDYDIRGFHLPSKDQYFSIFEPKEQYELKEKKLDFLSFSLDKAFNLLTKSNPTLLEWIRADKIYFNELPDFEKLRGKILDKINLKALFEHYQSMAKRNFEKYISRDKDFTYKRTLYVLRGLLSSLYIHEFKKSPPLKFNELITNLDLKQDLKKILRDVLNKKLKGTEEEEVADKEPSMKMIKNLFDRISGLDIVETGDKDSLFSLLNDYSIKINY